MEKWDQILKLARQCHTKQAWEELIFFHSETISSANSPKPINDLFKLLSSDPQSLQYNPQIFGIILKACLTCWDLELGKEICEFTSGITLPCRAIPAAQIFLEAGEPAKARDIAQKSLRLSSIKSKERCQLQLLICNSYVEEGKNNKAARIVSRIEVDSSDPEFSTLDQANTKVQLARLEFFLGRYLQACHLFKEASQLFLNLKEWEQAAKALFNTAACSQNAGKDPIEVAFFYVEESRKISEKFDLKGPLSHCEAFYGLDAFQHGNFAEAHERFRRALNYLPASDKSYRRLHILSMLALTYLASGRYHLARKFGRQTLELAALDKSDRHRSRYTSLDAELQWEDGQLESSQKILEKEINLLVSSGIHTLEEFSSYNRYLLQSAYLGESGLSNNKIKINNSLKRQTFTYLDYQYAVAQQHLCEKHFEIAYNEFSEIKTTAKKHSDKYHYALAILGLIEVKLAKRQTDEELSKLVSEFEISARRIGNSPLTSKVDIIQSAISYQTGDFKECERSLRSALKSASIAYSDRFSIQCWLATIEGKSCRLIDPLHVQLIARQTFKYFSPYLEVLDKQSFTISKYYEVNLARYPSLFDLLSFLIAKPNFSADVSDIQLNVWKQSLNSVGWQQKIRNTIMRIRDLFPYTMAPLILHHENIRLFSDAINIFPAKQDATERKNEVYRILCEQTMTTSQLSKRLQISPATTKRALKELVAQEKIKMTRSGRHIFYRTLS